MVVPMENLFSSNITYWEMIKFVGTIRVIIVQLYFSLQVPT